ncbi:MAG: hypothetical protein KTR24_06060 [Saprospiraceae bacterium]|nr:hypothetical protein [Saprospiraceae bacterium]
MREVTTLIFWICLSLTSGIAQDFAFENVHVITMQEEDEVLLNQNVLIRGDRILQIGDHGALQIPSNFTIIPGEGSAFLMPGMMDNHGHLPLPPKAYRYRSTIT